MKKVILVKSNMSELEKLLNKGWTLAAAFNHPQGSLVVLDNASVPNIYQPKQYVQR